MVIKINDHITDADMKAMQLSGDREIILDLKGLDYLTSYEISKLIVLYSENKVVMFKNANEYIQERLRIMKIEDIIQIIPPYK
ncbi:MAG: hypothetical protein JXJ04_04450 [Spirochaetales bacterium]|nr:hypothetical protein [Spirochaetales bacterium]